MCVKAVKVIRKRNTKCWYLKDQRKNKSKETKLLSHFWLPKTRRTWWIQGSWRDSRLWFQLNEFNFLHIFVVFSPCRVPWWHIYWELDWINLVPPQNVGHKSPTFGRDLALELKTTRQLFPLPKGSNILKRDKMHVHGHNKKWWQCDFQRLHKHLRLILHVLLAESW